MSGLMDAFTTLDGLVVPIDRANVDTDAIIPKQFMKSIRRTGFGPNLFDEWRYLDHGEPGQDPASRKPNPDFVLNQPRYQGASILLLSLPPLVTAHRMALSISTESIHRKSQFLLVGLIRNSSATNSSASPGLR